MPYIVHNEDGSSSDDLSRVKHDYDYPEGLDIKPGSKLHKKIKDEVFKRALEASAAISTRFDSWNQIDKVLTTYITTDEKEKAIKANDERKPTSIVFPYSYAILETILGYLSAAFFQDPMFRYEGVSPEDTIGAVMLEYVVALQTNKAKMALNLHTCFRDGLGYGFGIVAPYWKEDWGQRTVKKETGFISAISQLFQSQGYEKVVEDTLLYEGNALSNIDPYLCLPDPNVSIHNLQDGEFFGWVNKTNYLDLLSEEKHSNDLFNVKYVGSVHNKKTSIFGEDKSERNRKAGTTSSRTGSMSTKPVDEINMFIKVIPKEWGLGSNEYPEKWLFSLAADDVVTRAKPIDLDHNMFPVSVCAPDFDGYSTTPISRIETLYGLQGTLDWLFNAHIANVRKTINDMLIYDPHLVNSKDLKKPGPGKLIRMRKPAWGRGVKDSVMQLAVSDVTRGHIADAGLIRDAMDKIAATDSWSMGSLRQGGPERLTGKEFEGTQKGGYTRLERIARLVGVQAMQDIGYMFAHHTQQFMTKELSLTTTGRWQDVLAAEYSNATHMKVSPFDILIDYDVKVRDGSVPGSNSSGVWMQMFEALATQPELQQKFDIVRIFKHIARNSGAKNVDEFIKVQKQSDTQVEGQAQAGNIVPIDQILGGGA